MTLGKAAEDGSSVWDPATPVGNPGEVPGSSFQSASALPFE